MITGDTLFKGSYGRIDFKYGSRMDMYASLRRLLSLDPEITFYPGHGEESKIKYEM
jgi:glyoxylase-like metal-dependent hydrolase (beta-lactamase superfamily II)